MIKEILAYECTICGAVYKNPEDTDKHVCLKTPLKKLSEYKKVIMAATRLEEWMVDSIGKLTSDCPDDVWGPFEKALEDIRKRHFRKNK